MTDAFMRPATMEAVDLFHKGSIALTRATEHGMRIDEAYVNQCIPKLEKVCSDWQAVMDNDPDVKKYNRRAKTPFSPQSDKDVSVVVYKIKGFGAKKLREGSDEPSTDKEALNALKGRDPLIEAILEFRRFKKGLDALKDIQRETVDGILHPFFNLNMALSYRSSSDSINFQNQPVRDEEIAAIVRRAFIPRPGHLFMESDLKGAEVCAATCYHLDPVMIKFLKEGFDMHRQEARFLYLLTDDEVTKLIRYFAKNRFVFPQFYGSYWLQCAAALWQAISDKTVMTSTGVEMTAHLASKGITHLKSKTRVKYKNGKSGPPTDEHSFEWLVYTEERRFWDEQFVVYRDWKEQWWEDYSRNGFAYLLTGFVCSGHFWKNEIINIPVQGVAFHWLLWSFIRMTSLCTKHFKKTALVGQIHDSIVGDVHKDDRNAYIEMMQETVETKLTQHWPWIIVPVQVEIEESDTTWYDKKPVELS